MAPGFPRIIIDTREQNPLIIPNWARWVRAGLRTGDYALEGFDHIWAIERKTARNGSRAGDWWSSIGKDRERFERELQRLAGFRGAYLLIEGTWQEVTTPPEGSQITGRTSFRSLVSFCAGYGITPLVMPRLEAGHFIAYLLYSLWKNYALSDGDLHSPGEISADINQPSDNDERPSPFL